MELRFQNTCQAVPPYLILKQNILPRNNLQAVLASVLFVFVCFKLNLFESLYLPNINFD